jgi:membrane-bound lytic murein transglycosylase D
MMNTTMSNLRKTFFPLFLLLSFGLGVAQGEERDSASESLPADFPYPKALRPQVEFWKKIFSVYSRYQTVIHDSETMQIYKVLDFRRLRDEEGLDEATISQIKQDQTKLELELLRATFLKLQACLDGTESCEHLDSDEQKIWDMYKGLDDIDRFREAASEDRLRSQTGVRERFQEGVQTSRRYIKAMEEIFRREGLPVELTRLPLIESSFNLGATSKVGAAGIWQFMPSTGRIYAMRVSDMVDERRDPLIATEAAARFLRSNYERLGSWPLAITAYNHGPGGVATAVSTVGSSDIADIIRYYRGRAFGFASRNFYPEFLAAVEIEKNHKKHFGILDMEEAITYDEVYVDHPVPLEKAASCADTTVEELRSLNPALGSAIQVGNAAVPNGYQLRIPSGAATAFQERYAVWQTEERARLAALERARKERLAALKKARAARSAALRHAKASRAASVRKSKASKAVVRAKSGKRSSVSSAERVPDTKSRKRRG